MFDLLTVQRIKHDVPFQIDLVRVVDVLQLAAAARRDIFARWRDAMRGGFSNVHNLRKRGRALPVPDRHLDILAGDPALDEHGRALIVMRKTQPTMDHASETHRRDYSASRSRRRRFTKGMSAFPPDASFTARIS